MRRRSSVLLGLLAAPALCLPTAAPGQAQTAAPVSRSGASTSALVEERFYVESQVDTDGDGARDRVAIDVARPAGSNRLPVVFEQSPYRYGTNYVTNHGVDVDRLPQENLLGRTALSTTRPAGASLNRPMPDLPGWYDDYFVPRGYAVVLGMSIGTGDSDGCPSSGDVNEALGATAVVDWLNGRATATDTSGSPAEATWSNGSVGMIGLSYNGSLANMAAATGVAGLKAIVPESAVSSWYDYYRANGLVVAPGGYQGEDADVLAEAVTRPGCATRIAELTRQQDRVSGDETPFWQARDYVPKASSVTAAVFVMHGHDDWNVKGKNYSRWYEALRANGAPHKIWLHKGGHGAPTRADYQAAVGRWFDRYLKDVDNGIDREPKADVQLADGSWQQYADWPDPAARPTTFRLGATSATAPGELTTGTPAGTSSQAFVDMGRTRGASTLVASPDTADANRLVYRTAPLTSALRLSGTAKVTLQAAVDNRKDANLTALLVDYGSSSTTPTIVTRGWIDPQNRAGSRTSQAVVAGTEYPLTFDLQPKDHVFAAGRRIGLVVISTDYDYTLRPATGTSLHLAPGQSSLSLPLVGSVAPTDDFAVSVSPASVSVEPGASATATVGTRTTSGAAQQVALSATGLPAGATASFAPSTVTSGGPSTLTVATSASTPAGTYPVTISGSGPSGSRTAALTLTVTGGPPTGTCAGRKNTRTGTLASGATAIQPDGKWYQTSTSGTHTACLDGPDGTDLDLRLQKWNGSSWTTVASATTSSPDETLTYSGAAGYYRYQVNANSGNGSYTLGYDTP